MRDDPSAKAWRLLRLLLLWIGSVPASPKRGDVTRSSGVEYHIARYGFNVFGS